MKHLIFLHIPKNGGSTFLSLLQRIYKNKKIFSVHWIGEKGNLNDFLNLPQSQKDEIQLITGHFSYGMHKNFSKESEYCTFLRKPDKRLLSFYSFVKRRPQNRLYKKVVENNMSFKDFILLNDKDGNNGQIRKLSGINGNESEMLELALNYINKHFPVVGLLEMYDESLVVMAEYYNWPTPFYFKVNVSKNKTNITPEELDLIKRNNKGDYELYRIMEKRLKQQMSEIPNFKFKLFKLKTINKLVNNKFIKYLIFKLALI